MHLASSFVLPSSLPSSSVPRVHVVDAEMASYRECARYIEHMFWVRYGASIEVTYPILLSLYDAVTHMPSAALGVRGAEELLFLERYLHASAERVIAERLEVPVRREHIAEAGNLASSGQKNVLWLLYALSLYLEVSGYRYILFTATHALARYLSHLGLQPHTLAEASLDRLEEAERARWGSYYDTRPLVMLGRVEDFRSGLTCYFSQRKTLSSESSGALQ